MSPTVAPAASRRFCAAMLVFNHCRYSRRNRFDGTLSPHRSLSPRAHKNAGWQPALRFGISPCA